MAMFRQWRELTRGLFRLHRHRCYLPAGTISRPLQWKNWTYRLVLKHQAVSMLRRIHGDTEKNFLQCCLKLHDIRIVVPWRRIFCCRTFIFFLTSPTVVFSSSLLGDDLTFFSGGPLTSIFRFRCSRVICSSFRSDGVFLLIGDFAKRWRKFELWRYCIGLQPEGVGVDVILSREMFTTESICRFKVEIFNFHRSNPLMTRFVIFRKVVKMNAHIFLVVHCIFAIVANTSDTHIDDAYAWCLDDCNDTGVENGTEGYWDIASQDETDIPRRTSSVSKRMYMKGCGPCRWTANINNNAWTAWFKLSQPEMLNAETFLHSLLIENFSWLIPIF